MEPLYHYVIVRRDLELGPLAVSVHHASGESSPGGLPGDTHGIVLMVPDEGALMAVAARLEKRGVAFVRIIETDAPFEGQLMSLGLVPGRKEVVGRHVSWLPLLR